MSLTITKEFDPHWMSHTWIRLRQDLYKLKESFIFRKSQTYFDPNMIFHLSISELLISKISLNFECLAFHMHTL